MHCSKVQTGSVQSQRFQIPFDRCGKGAKVIETERTIGDMDVIVSKETAQLAIGSQIQQFAALLVRLNTTYMSKGTVTWSISAR